VSVSLLNRRRFLSASAVGAVGAAVATGRSSDAAEDGPAWFRHGVASGDPLPHAVVLWTRVTPTPDATPGSGIGPPIDVDWQIARDRGFRHIVNRGRVTTGPRRDHTVKVDATRLAPDTTYYYRFVADGHRSRVGRTTTAPADEATPRRLRFGVVSCSNWQAGWFSPYRHLARRDDLDAVLHLGDYLYEYGPGEYGLGQANLDVRRHLPKHEMVTLGDYRRRHGQYKTDPDLADLHAAAPWIVTWDDHETTNDAWREGAENHNSGEGDWATRKAAARRAYDEWMPVRLSSTTAIRDGSRIYRRLRFGRLAELSMLDLRSYRSQQAGDDLGSVDDADRTITGHQQLRWLLDGLADSPAQWKLIGNPVMVAPVLIPPLPTDVTDALVDVTGLLPKDGVPYNADQWDGYQADRRRLVRFLADHGITDTVFLTGDIHSAWACDLPQDAGRYPLSPSVATELVCSSVSSNNVDDMLGVPERTASLTVEAAIQAANRHVRYVDLDRHGYSVLEVTPARVQMDWYATSDRADPMASSAHAASWVVDAGTQKVRPAPDPIG
jgi:alkaline phosphatase D